MGLFNDIVKQILIENILLTEADDRIKKVNKIIDAEFGNTLNLDGPVSGPEYYINDREGNPNPNTTWRQYLLFSLRHTFGLMTNNDVKYLPFVAKLAFSDEVGFEKRNDNGTEVAALQNIVMLLKKDDELFNNVKSNPSITFDELYEELKPQLEALADADSEAANNVEEHSDYDIEVVPDFKTANHYGNYTCSSSKLCYTQNEGTWKDYTKDYRNKVYVCLKHGWENIPEEPGEGNPYDEYGTSMIFVFIDPNGDIAYSNCRWNHKTVGEYNGSVDHAFTKTSLAETVGVRFDDVFKPYSKEEEAERMEQAQYEEEERMERYSQERWDNGVSLWDGCTLLVGFDDNYDFDENDTNYYVYNTNEDDYAPLLYDEVDADPLYLNENEEIAILKKQYGPDCIIVAELDTNRGYIREELCAVPNVLYYKIFKIGGSDLICFNGRRVEERRGNGDNNFVFGFIYERKCGFSKESFNFGLTLDESEKDFMFINENVNENLQPNDIAIEVIDDNNRHSLFIINIETGEVKTVIKKDFPKGDMFQYDEERDVVIGTLGNYSLEGVMEGSYEGGGRIVSIDENIYGDYYIVSVEPDENNNTYNLVKKGEYKKIIPFDFDRYTISEELGVFIPKKRIGSKKFDYESYLFDLSSEKIVSKPHTDFLYKNGVLVGGDCKTENVKDAEFYFINKSNYLQEEGPYMMESMTTIPDGKTKLKGDDGFCYVFDSNQFKFVLKCVDCFVMLDYSNGKKNAILYVQSISDNNLYLYNAKTMQRIVDRPVDRGATMERGYVFVHYVDEQGGYNIFDIEPETSVQIFPQDVKTLKHEHSDMFAIGENGSFTYIFDLIHCRLLPTEYGVDFTNAISPWYNSSGGRIYFFVEGNEHSREDNTKNAVYRIRYEMLMDEDDNIFYCETNPENIGVQITNWDLIGNAPQDVQIKANAVLYPQKKVQIMNKFNEMLNRMNRTRNGSILL